jgi:hypothetical protein
MSSVNPYTDLKDQRTDYNYDPTYNQTDAKFKCSEQGYEMGLVPQTFLFLPGKW